MDENRTVLSVPCQDASGRDRTFQIVGEPGHFTLVAPPGGSGRFRPHQYEALRQALRDVLPIAWKESR